MADSTARTLIRQALLAAEAVGWNDTVSGTTIETDALVTLNDMLGLWSAEGLNVPFIARVTKTLTDGTAEYTIGSSGDIATGRPAKIVGAFIRDTGNNDYPLEIYSMKEYGGIASKTSESRPQYLFYNPEYASGRILLYPTPDASTDVLHIYKEDYLTELATITTSVTLPPEYREAIKYNLALRFIPENATTNKDLILALANNALNIIKRNNSKDVPRAVIDEALIANGYGYNVYTDDN